MQGVNKWTFWTETKRILDRKKPPLNATRKDICQHLCSDCSHMGYLPHIRDNYRKFIVKNEKRNKEHQNKIAMIKGGKQLLDNI